LVKYTFFEAEFGKLPATQLEKAKNWLTEFLNDTLEFYSDRSETRVTSTVSFCRR
jgi:hypothetical protein